MKAFKVVLGLLAVVQILTAKVIYVDDNASAGGDGNSWSSAHNYLQDALAVAQSGDEVWVAEGTYKPDQGNGIMVGDRTASFNLVNGVSLYGGFTGNEITRYPKGDKNQTVLSGAINSDAELWTLNVVSGVNIDNNTIIDGFRITKGNANGNTTKYSSGGGIYFEDSNVNLSEIVMSFNSALNGGAISIVYSYDGSPPDYAISLRKCFFENNSAGSAGGGIYISFENSLYTVTFSECRFIGNSAGNSGGAISFPYTGLAEGKYINVSNCGFSDNSSGYLGGAIAADSDAMNLSVDGSIFYGNETIVEGGALYSSYRMFGNSLSVNGCTFVQNSAYEGGSIFSTSTFTLSNSIMWDNTSTESDGWSGQSFTVIDDGIHEDLWRNYATFVGVKAKFPGDPDAKETVFAKSNIIQNWGNDTQAFIGNPLFIDIDDPTGLDGIWFTMDDGLRLQPESPAIDAGYDLNDSGKYDIAGFIRRQGLSTDIGAYEYGNLNVSAYNLVTTSNPINAGNISGGGTFVEDTSVTLTATPSNSGYIFSGWSGDASGTSNPLTITADSDKTITANFSKDDGDDDGDGISNYEEIVTYGTNKSSNDSDGDGLTDKEETDRGLNPNSSDKAIIDAVMELKGMKADNVTPIVNDWYYVPNRGWFWTSKDVYPYTYSVEDNDWMYFQSGNEKPKFYRYKTKDWVTFE